MNGRRAGSKGRITPPAADRGTVMNGHRGASLIGMLVALVIVCVIGIILYGKLGTKETAPTRPGGPTTRLGQSIEKGTEVDCSNNLRQIRTAITMEETSDPNSTAPPPDLASLRKDGINQNMLSCPVSHQPYQYDPRSGRVWCVTPGHERF